MLTANGPVDEPPAPLAITKVMLALEVFTSTSPNDPVLGLIDNVADDGSAVPVRVAVADACAEATVSVAVLSPTDAGAKRADTVQEFPDGRMIPAHASIVIAKLVVLERLVARSDVGGLPDGLVTVKVMVGPS